MFYFLDPDTNQLWLDIRFDLPSIQLRIFLNFPHCPNQIRFVKESLKVQIKFSLKLRNIGNEKGSMFRNFITFFGSLIRVKDKPLKLGMSQYKFWLAKNYYFKYKIKIRSQLKLKRDQDYLSII